MNFIKQNIEAQKIRNALSANQLPVDEEVFCSALTNSRVLSFDKLNDNEFKDLKRLVDAFTHQQLLEGIYSIADELKVIYGKGISETNDKKIIDYLKGFGVINKLSQFKMPTPKGEVITFNAPLKAQSFYSLSLFSFLMSQVYCLRSSVLN